MHPRPEGMPPLPEEIADPEARPIMLSISDVELVDDDPAPSYVDEWLRHGIYY